MARKLKIRDLTLRDGHQSLFATRLKSKHVEQVIEDYKDAGFYAMEVWGGAVPDSVMRYLDESPWTRLNSISKVIEGRSYLTALSRGRNLFGYAPYPNTVIDGFYKEAVKQGLGIMRIFDALNDLNNVESSIKKINEVGGIADGAVCYTVDPKPSQAAPEKVGFFARLFGKKPAAPEKIFTDEYFVEKAKGMEAMGAKIITLKDMAGLVNPARITTLIPALKKAVSVPVDFHTHCTPGYGLASSLMAVIHGVDILDTNIWYFGGGSAAPAIELIYVFCQKLGIELEANMEAVGRIRVKLEDIRRDLRDFDLQKDSFPRAFDPLKDTLPAEVDAQFDRAIAAAKANDEAALLDACHAIEAYFNFPKANEIVKHAEVPGGMYSNMVAQLKSLGAEDVLNDAMALIPEVRRAAGLVPLVTPTSQIVGGQAVSLAIDRKKGNPDYTMVSNQFINLIKGEYGKTPVAIDPKFREKITGSPVEKPYDINAYQAPENPTLPEFGGVKLAKDESDYLLLQLFPTVGATFLRNRRAEEYAAAPKAEVVEEKKAAEEPITGPVQKIPMGGSIISVAVQPGAAVKKGQALLVYEAMKMENTVNSEREGVIKRVFVQAGQVVATNAVLVEFEG
ncbi:MAG: carboxylase [Bacteroidaceae bacterium]|nr:carboxylase [Bacteroidaceae bacterium]